MDTSCAQFDQRLGQCSPECSFESINARITHRRQMLGGWINDYGREVG
jgi:hypothetical protein